MRRLQSFFVERTSEAQAMHDMGGCVHVLSTVRVGSRRRTHSRTSMTKMTSLIRSRTGVSIPSTVYFWSKILAAAMAPKSHGVDASG